MIGTGSPSLTLTGPDAQAVPSVVQGALSIHNQDDTTAGPGSTGGIEDVVDLSENLQTELRRGRQPSDVALNTGRGDTGDTGGALKQIQDQIGFLRDLLQSTADPGQSSELGRGLDEIEAALAREASAVNGPGETQASPREFVSLVIGFREIVKEVEKILADENRVPPPLMRIIKDMTSKSLKIENRKRVDEFA